MFSEVTVLLIWLDVGFLDAGCIVDLGNVVVRCLVLKVVFSLSVDIDEPVVVI